MGKLVILTGTSGAGKTTVAGRLLECLPEAKRLVTCTTREKRTGESEGVDYHFLTKEKFQEDIRYGNFIEWAPVYDNCYGSRKCDIDKMLQSNSLAIVIVDIQGAKKLADLYPKALIVFLASTKEELLFRLTKREDCPLSIQKRIDEYDAEIANSSQFGVPVYNNEGKLEDTIEEVLLRIKD